MIIEWDVTYGAPDAYTVARWAFIEADPAEGGECVLLYHDGWLHATVYPSREAAEDAQRMQLDEIASVLLAACDITREEGPR
jgi:hypothetical protein